MERKKIKAKETALKCRGLESFEKETDHGEETFEYRNEASVALTSWFR